MGDFNKVLDVAGVSKRFGDIEVLSDVSFQVDKGETICVLGPSIPSSIGSAIRMFRDEFLVHVKEGGCPFD